MGLVLDGCLVCGFVIEVSRWEIMGSANEFFDSTQFSLDPKWIVDPKQLFVGPKIGEGAHAKVYEGKYVKFVNLFLI